MLDIILLLIILSFTFLGWRKGLLAYFLEILITLLSLAASGLFYRLQKQLLNSILVFFLVLCGLSLLKWLLLKLRAKKLSRKPFCSLSRRLLGALLGLIWGILIGSLLIFSLDLFPQANHKVKQAIRDSRAYRLSRKLFAAKEVPVLKDIDNINKISRNPRALKRLKAQPQFQELLQHNSLKTALQDPRLREQLQNKDLPKLLTNPKFINLLNDREFIEKLLQLDLHKALKEGQD